MRRILTTTALVPVAAPTLVSSGLRGNGNNVATTIPLPPTWSAGNLLIAAALYSSPAGSLATPSGWTLVSTNSDSVGKLYLYSRIAQSADVAPVVTPSGGATGDGILGGIVAYSSGSIVAIGPSTVNASARDIFVEAATATVAPGATLFVGARNSGYAVSSALSGDGLTWTETWDFSEGSLGSFLVGSSAEWSTLPTLTDKTFVLSGGTGTSYGRSIVIQ